MVKSIGIDSAATNLSWSSVSKSAGLKSSITIFFYTLSRSRGSQICCLTNRCKAPKDLLLFDQKVKSPDSGLRADDALSKCIRCSFPRVSQTKMEEGLPDRRLLFTTWLHRWLPDCKTQHLDIRPLAFATKLCPTGCETFTVIAWLTTYDRWLLLRNFALILV